MATVFGEPEGHPVAALVARFHADLDQLGDPRLWSMSEHELAETLTAVAALRHRFTELELRVANQADHHAALKSMEAFATTDFRDDLPNVTVPALIIHGDSDGTVPFEGSGKRTHEALVGSELVLVEGAPHGLNVSHKEQFNTALISFLGR